MWLRQQRRLDGVGCECDAERASVRIWELRSDAVIVDTGQAKRTPLAALMCLLANQPGSRIIGVNLEDNCVSIYGSGQHLINRWEQLLEAIQGKPAD